MDTSYGDNQTCDVHSFSAKKPSTFQCLVVWSVLPVVCLICASFWLSLFLTGISQGDSATEIGTCVGDLNLNIPLVLNQLRQQGASQDINKLVEKPSKDRCKLTCNLEVVESIPENLTFEGHIPRSTYDAWNTLIQMAETEIDIAAYKSSLRGKHVLGDSAPSSQMKMELGVLLTNCPCMAEDVKRVFDSYWALTLLQNATNDRERYVKSENVVAPEAEYNEDKPLRILHKGEKTDIYLATSPKELNGRSRTWDLNAILAAINSAEKYLYIHVMDYIPMIVYREPQKYWPVIDDAIRKAVMERNVEVKLLAAALHFVPQTLRFLKSLQALNGASDGKVEVKIFHVPPMTETQSVIARERRTHNKFLVSEDTVVIGTSNWSGDYFIGNTGVALIVKQAHSRKRPFVQEMRDIFMRDWNSAYAHPLNNYINACLYNDGSSQKCSVQKQAS